MWIPDDVSYGKRHMGSQNMIIKQRFLLISEQNLCQDGTEFIDLSNKLYFNSIHL
jgi:hypothetical protein